VLGTEHCSASINSRKWAGGARTQVVRTKRRAKTLLRFPLHWGSVNHKSAYRRRSIVDSICPADERGAGNTLPWLATVCLNTCPLKSYSAVVGLDTNFAGRGAVCAVWFGSAFRYPATIPPSIMGRRMRRIGSTKKMSARRVGLEKGHYSKFHLYRTFRRVFA